MHYLASLGDRVFLASGDISNLPTKTIAVFILLATPVSRGRASWSVAPVQVAPVLRLHTNYYEKGGSDGHFSLMDSWTRSRGGGIYLFFTGTSYLF